MDQKSTHSRMQKLTPLLLRLGIAAALMSHGYRQVLPAGGNSPIGDQAVPLTAQAEQLAHPDGAGPAMPAEPEAPVAFSPAGVAVQTDWSQILGGAEIIAAVALALGLLTRLISLAMLSTVGLAGFGQDLGITDGSLGRLLENLPQAGTPTLILLATACLVLLMSGCGCLGVDGRLFSRSRSTDTDLTTP